MNHSFTPSKLNVIVCATCARSMLAHTNAASCESCGRSDKCDIVNDILLCQDCFSRELECSGSESNNKPTGFANLPVPQSEVIYTTAKSIASDLPANGSEFYNAKVLAIVELEARINADANIGNKPFFFAQQIKARQAILYKALVEARELLTEIGAEQHANYRAINALASRLKKEEREKLNIKYAEYVPSSKVGKVRQPRTTAQDKVIEGIAKMMFAPRKDGIIQWEALEASERQACIEKAKQYFRGNLK